MLLWNVVKFEARRASSQRALYQFLSSQAEGKGMEMSIDFGKVGIVMNSLKAILGDGQKETQLVQQTSESLFGHRNDEAIELALDALLNPLQDLRPYSNYTGEQCVDALTEIRLKLKPHQRADWRKNYAGHKLTEKFENVLVEEHIERFQDQQQQAGQQQQRRRQPIENIRRRHDRRQRDYEYTLEDPRIQHLIFVADKFLRETDEKNGFKKAYDYLIGAELIQEKSGLEKTGGVISAGASEAHHILRAMQLGRSYNATMVRHNLTPAAKEAHLDQLMREKIDRRKERVRDFRWRPSFGAIIILITIIIAAGWSLRSIGS